MNKKLSTSEKISIWGIVVTVLIAVTTFVVSKIWPDKTNQETYQVSSANQFGGITAGKIVIQNTPEARTLTKADKNKISETLSMYPGRIAEVSIQMGSNSESLEFAEQIKKFIEDSGYTIDTEISQSVFVKSDVIFSNVTLMTNEPKRLVFGVLPK